MRPLVLSVDLSAIVSNYRFLRGLYPFSEVFVVLKANAYGHGARECASVLDFCDGFALCSIDEAVTLRDYGVKSRILLLEGFFEKDELELVERLGLDIVVHNFWQLEVLERFTGRVGRVFVKYNLGMNRLGFRVDELDGVFSRLSNRSCVLMTHFPRADLEGVGAECILGLESLKRRHKVKSSFFSTAAALFVSSKFAGHDDLIRCGIGIYGINPISSFYDYPLVPAMSLKTKIIATQDVAIGEYVGYGDFFRAEKEMRVGVLAAGYADGIPRVLRGANVLINGQLAPVVGFCAMDMMFVDITRVSCSLGDLVEIFGANHSVEGLATAAGTVPYEILTSMKRAKRLYNESF